MNISKDKKKRGGARLALLLAAGVAAGAMTVSALPEEAQAQARPARRTTLKPSDLTLEGSVAGRPLVLVAALGALSLLPFVIIMVTSFVKISVVLSIVRSALGTQQIPPTQVITGLAIILTVYIMAPVGLEMYKSTEKLVLERAPGQLPAFGRDRRSGLGRGPRGQGADEGLVVEEQPPQGSRDVLHHGQTPPEGRGPERRGPEDFMVLIPAFVISELKESFQIGFIIFVPFLVIDMVVANILMALGMQMLSPTTISLPFKLLLFVMIDGWYLHHQGPDPGVHLPWSKTSSSRSPTRPCCSP
jgi:type III secretion protein R